MNALSIFLNIVGEMNISTASSYHNIGLIYYEIQDFDQAFDYFNRASKISISIGGENHMLTATTYNSIGNVHYRKGDLNKAFKYCR